MASGYSHFLLYGIKGHGEAASNVAGMLRQPYTLEEAFLEVGVIDQFVADGCLSAVAGVDRSVRRQR